MLCYSHHVWFVSLETLHCQITSNHYWSFTCLLGIKEEMFMSSLLFLGIYRKNLKILSHALIWRFLGSLFMRYSTKLNARFVITICGIRGVGCSKFICAYMCLDKGKWHERNTIWDQEMESIVVLAALHKRFDLRGSSAETWEERRQWQ